MGAGSFGAGLGPAGLSPNTTGPVIGTSAPNAIRFEGSTRDWVLESDGSGKFVPVTPNEQGVVLALSINKGDLKSSPTTGNDLGKIQYTGGNDLGAIVTNAVMNSNPIARLVAANSVSIDTIRYQVSPTGKLSVAVYFRDLDADPTKTLGPVGN